MLGAMYVCASLVFGGETDRLVYIACGVRSCANIRRRYTRIIRVRTEIDIMNTVRIAAHVHTHIHTHAAYAQIYTLSHNTTHTRRWAHLCNG